MFLNQYEEALAAVQKYNEILGEEPWVLNITAYLYAQWGKKEKSEKYLKKLIEKSEKKFVSPVMIANIYGALGPIHPKRPRKGVESITY